MTEKDRIPVQGLVPHAGYPVIAAIAIAEPVGHQEIDKVGRSDTPGKTGAVARPPGQQGIMQQRGGDVFCWNRSGSLCPIRIFTVPGRAAGEICRSRKR